MTSQLKILANMIVRKCGNNQRLVKARAIDIQSGGYSCDTMRLKITYRLPHGKRSSIASYFVKGISSEGILKLQSLSVDNEKLKNERNTYRTSIPILQKYLGEHSPLPKCILDTPQLIVLEDLAECGFVNRDICNGLSFAEAIAAIKVLAMWHAASFNLKNDSMEEYVKITETAEDVVFPVSQRDFLDQLWQNTMRTTLDTLDSIAREKKNGELQKLTDILRAKYGQGSLISVMDKYLRKSDKSAFSVLTHGDFWIKNIMFDEDNNVKVVDFQCVFERSMAVDIWTFIVSSIHPREGKLHFDDIINAYCKALETSVPASRYDFSSCLLKQEMHLYTEYAFLLGIWYLPAHTMTLTGEDIVNYQKGVSEGKACCIFEGKDKTLYKEKLYHHVMMFSEFISSLK